MPRVTREKLHSASGRRLELRSRQVRQGSPRCPAGGIFETPAMLYCPESSTKPNGIKRWSEGLPPERLQAAESISPKFPFFAGTGVYLSDIPLRPRFRISSSQHPLSNQHLPNVTFVSRIASSFVLEFETGQKRMTQRSHCSDRNRLITNSVATIAIGVLTACGGACEKDGPNTAKYTLENKFITVTNDMQDYAARSSAYGRHPSMCEPLPPAARQEVTGWAVRTMQTEYVFREERAHEVMCMHHLDAEVHISKDEMRTFYDEPDFLSTGSTVKLEWSSGNVYVLHRKTSQGFDSNVEFEEDETKQDSDFAVKPN